MRRFVILGLALAVAGCSNTGLRDLRSNSGGPDEFRVQPGKPLSAPDSYSALPAPTPGAGNRVDATPQADAVAALGGNPNALVPQGPSRTDGALVSHTGRYGVTQDIRADLRQEDEAFRTRRARLTNFRLFRVDRYNQVYRGLALDAFAENRRFRRAGVRTPAAPPETN